MKRKLAFIAIVSGVLAYVAWITRDNFLLRRQLNQAFQEPASATSLPQEPVQETRRDSSVSSNLPVQPVSNPGRPAADELFRQAKRESAEDWKDPAYREYQRKVAALGVELDYGRLFQQLRHLGTERLEILKDYLVSEAYEVQAGYGTRPEISPDEIVKYLAEVEQAKIDSEKALRAALGEDYEVYDLYNKSRGFRPFIENVTNVMRARGMNVSSEMQEAVLAAYTKAIARATDVAVAMRKNASGDDDTAKQALKVEQRNSLDRITIEECAKILDPEALKFFLDAQLAVETAPPALVAGNVFQGNSRARPTRE